MAAKGYPNSYQKGETSHYLTLHLKPKFSMQGQSLRMRNILSNGGAFYVQHLLERSRRGSRKEHIILSIELSGMGVITEQILDLRAL